MPEMFEFCVNNQARKWVATVDRADGDGWKARTRALGREFEAQGKDSQEALAALRAAMEKFGWFFSEPFKPRSA